MSDEKPKKPPAAARPASPAAAPTAGASRLFALLVGGGLALLGVLGFFYDAGFGTGTSLADDDLAGVLIVNGWRNVVYLTTGLLALGFASRAPRAAAFGLGGFYLVFAIWGLEVTDHGIGSILDLLPLGNNDNALHLAVGLLGICAVLMDGGLAVALKALKTGRGDPRQSPARPRRGADA